MGEYISANDSCHDFPLSFQTGMWALFQWFHSLRNGSGLVTDHKPWLFWGCFSWFPHNPWIIWVIIKVKQYFFESSCFFLLETTAIHQSSPRPSEDEPLQLPLWCCCSLQILCPPGFWHLSATTWPLRGPIPLQHHLPLALTYKKGPPLKDGDAPFISTFCSCCYNFGKWSIL